MGVVVVVDFGRIAREAVGMLLWTADKQQSHLTSNAFVILGLRIAMITGLDLTSQAHHRHACNGVFRTFR